MRVFKATMSGDRPTSTVGIAPLQPAGCEPLQVAPLMTDTVPGVSPFVLFATYTVCASTATPNG